MIIMDVQSEKTYWCELDDIFYVSPHHKFVGEDVGLGGA